MALNTQITNSMSPNSRIATYQGAREVAPVVELHFARHIAEARARGQPEDLAPEPDATTIEAIIDAVTFWSSLRREEGRSQDFACLPVTATGRTTLNLRTAPSLNTRHSDETRDGS